MDSDAVCPSDTGIESYGYNVRRQACTTKEVYRPDSLYFLKSFGEEDINILRHTDIGVRVSRP